MAKSSYATPSNIVFQVRFSNPNHHTYRMPKDSTIFDGVIINPDNTKKNKFFHSKLDFDTAVQALYAETAKASRKTAKKAAK